MPPLDVDAISGRLPGRQIYWLGETDSTMNDAARLARFGAPSGTVAGAELQTAGQGRLGRAWHSCAEDGIYCSVILRVALRSDELPLVTMAAGLAAAEAIGEASGLPVDLRWPNDVLVGDRKVCGILVQHHHDALICGIGINVNQRSFPEELTPIATSLRIAGGREYPREPLVSALLLALDRHVDLLRSQGKSAVLRLFEQASSYVRGRRVAVEQADRILFGVTAGLDGDGFLVLEEDSGARTVILAGGVRPA